MIQDSEHWRRTKRWERMRRLHLQRQPLCAFCERRGVTTAATIVDHIVPHKGDAKLFWDTNNYQSACKTCHDSVKAQIERSGFSKEIGLDGWPTDPNHPVYRNEREKR
jgi:5-methylcytosine-specific restriction protein A